MAQFPEYSSTVNQMINTNNSIPSTTSSFGFGYNTGNPYFNNYFNNYNPFQNFKLDGVSNIQNVNDFWNSGINGISIDGKTYGFDRNGVIVGYNGNSPIYKPTSDFADFLNSKDVTYLRDGQPAYQGQLGSKLGNSWLGKNWGTLKDIANIGLAAYGVYDSMQKNQMMQDQYDFQKNLVNRNLANQAKILNNAYDSSARIAAGMVSNDPKKTRQLEKDSLALASRQHVDGSPIG